MTTVRRRARVAVATSVLAGLATLAVITQLHRRACDVPVIVPVDGAIVRGLVRRSVGADVDFTLRADSAHVERARLGPFRIGVTRELSARGVRLDVVQSRAPRTSSSGVAMPRSDTTRAFTRLHVQDVALRLREPAGAVFKMRADTCDAGIATGAVVTCRGRVRVRDGQHAWTFDEIRWDVATAAIVSARGRSALADTAGALQDGLRRIAASRVVERVWPAAGGRDA